MADEKGLIKITWTDSSKKDYEFYILCSKVPAKNSGPAELCIPGISRVELTDGKTDFERITIPITKTEPSGISSDNIITIELAESLVDGKMTLPYDGGLKYPTDPAFMITFTANKRQRPQSQP